MRIALLTGIFCSLAALAQAQSPAPTIEEVEAQIKAAEEKQGAAEQAKRNSEVARKADAERQARVKREAAAAVTAQLATLLIRSDAECNLSINGQAQGVLAVGETKPVKVSPGDQIVDCASAENSDVVVSEVKTASAGTQLAVVLALAAKVATQRQAEEQAAPRQAAASRFSTGSDSSVIDAQTGLTWDQADNGADIDWKGAQRWCSDRGGRLPSMQELEGLEDATGSLQNACAPDYFCRTSPLFTLTSFVLWSGEPNGTSEAWTVTMHYLSRFAFPVKTPNVARALCVRPS